MGMAAVCLLLLAGRATFLGTVQAGDLQARAEDQRRVPRVLPARRGSIVARDGVSSEDARRRIHESDETRRRYVWAAGQRDWADPTLYDLVINTHRSSPEIAASLVVDGARRAGVLGS